MTEIDNAIVTPLETLFSYVPGGHSPAIRAAIGFAGGAAFAHFVKPSVSYDADGKPRPWIVTNSKDANGTWFPYWAWSVLPGALAGLFV